jgi:putative ABC transport system permease protein
VLFARLTSAAAVSVILRDVVVPVGFNAAPDWRVLVFAAVLAILTAIAISLVPAWRVARNGSAAWLRSDGRTSTAGRRTWKMLTIAQVAATLVLLMNAGLLVRTLHEVRSLDLGWTERDVTIAYPEGLPDGYRDVDNDVYLPRLAAQLRRLPGVEAVSFTLFKPAVRNSFEDTVSLPSPEAAARVDALAIPVSPDFFRSVGMSILRGRDFTWSDNSGSRRVAIVSRSLAERFFGGQPEIGSGLRIGHAPPYQTVEIVGIVSDSRLFSVMNGNPLAVYTAALQQGTEANGKAILVKGRPSRADVRSAVRSLGREDVMEMTPLAQTLDDEILPERLTAMLAGFFGVLALLVASIGIYGVMSYHIARRTREIGVRLALGADARRVLASVLAEGLGVTCAGLALGFGTGLWTVRYVRSLLFGIGPYDPLTLGASVAALLLVAAVACARPGIKAAHVDPLVALRSE